MPVDEGHVLVQGCHGGERGVDLGLLGLGNAHVDDVDVAVRATGLDHVLHLVGRCGHVGEGLQDDDLAHHALREVFVEHGHGLVGAPAHVGVHETVGEDLVPVPLGVAGDRVADEDGVIEAGFLLGGRRVQDGVCGRGVGDGLGRGRRRGVLGRLAAEVHRVAGVVAGADDGVLGDEGLRLDECEAHAVADDCEREDRRAGKGKPAGEGGGAPAGVAGVGTRREEAGDGLLDELVAELSQEKRQHDDQHGLPPGSRVAGRTEQLDEREVPEVDAVRARAQPGERGQAEHGGQDAAGKDERREQDAGEQRREEHAAAIEQHGGVGDEHHGHHQQGERDEGGELDGEASRFDEIAQVAGGTPSERHRVGKPCAGERCEEAGVGSVVDARDAGVGVVEEAHGNRGDDGRNQGEPAGSGAGGQDGEEHHDERPDEAELRVDAQIPQVGERRRTADLVEVGKVAQDVAQVLAEREAGKDVRARLGEQHVVEADAGKHREDDHDGGRRPDAREPSNPEMRDRRKPVAQATQQRGGDEVAREHEEHDHAEVARREPGDVEVVEEHRDDGQGTKSVNRAVAPRVGWTARAARVGRTLGGGPPAAGCGASALVRRAPACRVAASALARGADPARVVEGTAVGLPASCCRVRAALCHGLSRMLRRWFDPP